MTNPTPPQGKNAAKGGMTVTAERGSGYVRLEIVIPENAELFEVLLPEDRVGFLVEDLIAAAEAAREPRLRPV